MDDRIDPSRKSEDIIQTDSDGNFHGDFTNSPYDVQNFEGQDEEFEPSRPYKHIVHSSYLPLGVSVLSISFHSLPSDLHDQRLKYLPKLFSKSLVILAGCSDTTLRLITLPLNPPSPGNKTRPQTANNICLQDGQYGSGGEKVVIISSLTTRNSIPTSLSLTATSRSSEQIQDPKTSGETKANTKGEPRYYGQKDLQWHLLIAAQYADLSGVVDIHKILLTTDEAGVNMGKRLPNMSPETHYLTSPAVSIQFNPSLCPDPKHATLLVAEKSGAVRIIDSLPHDDSGQASWAVSLYAPFLPGQGMRKQILDARWVLSGKAILTLLSDGEWGVWDLEDSSPKPKKGHNGFHKPMMESFSGFAIHGWVNHILSNNKLMSENYVKDGRKAKLAPMTPGTRQIRQENLFSGLVTLNEGPPHGGLAVCPTSYGLHNRADDEKVLFWYNENIIVIPSLLTYWQNKIKGSGNLFGNGAKGEPKEFRNPFLCGEQCHNVVLVASRQWPGQFNAGHNDIWVVAENRLVLITPRLSDSPKITNASSATSADQKLLSRGELDVDGMNRILSSMKDGNGRSKSTQHRPLPPRRVNFSIS